MNRHPYDPMKSITLVELLRWRAQHQPGRRAYTFLVDGETKEVHLTYQKLDRQARAIGARLQSLGAAGERVLLLYPPGLEYIAGFFGCLYAGAVAVPAYPPDPARLNRTLPRLQTIVADAQATVALTTSPILAVATLLFSKSPDLQALRWVATDEVADDLAEEWQNPEGSGDTLAFLQYTSGSTAAPRGVMLTHDNLLHNSALIYECFGHTPDSQGMVWLPPYHDMGLIGGILQPLYGGFPVTLMSPIDFLKRPFRWLQAVSRYEATTSGGPNFAYDLCVRKIMPEQRATLDLSSWDLAFNGAEPVCHETMDRFAATFEACGFRREAFYPCYGLAEATLIVSGGRKAEPPVIQTVNGTALGRDRVESVASTYADARPLVGCGHALADQRIVIVDPDTFQSCPADQIGEIWVSGPSVAQGYWNQPEGTAEAFQAYVANTGEGPFLRTSDLGFLRDGDLFITGRIKDLIIIRGRNHYPQDIERTVERSHPALRPGCCAAFSVEVDGEERLVVAQEVRRQVADLELDEIVQTIRQAVAEEHELQAYGVLLLQARTIPKTSSGKIQRHACRAGFLSDGLDVVAESILDVDEDVPSVETPSIEPEADFIRRALMAVSEPTDRHSLLMLYLQQQAARALRLSPSQVDAQQPLGTLGLDSLMAVELKHQVETSLGVVLPMVDLLRGPSISQLASQILAELAEPSIAHTALPMQGREAAAEYPLSYGQRALWLVHRLALESAAYNIARAVRIQTELDVPALQRSFQKLVDRHPSLRATFLAPQGEPVQRIHDEAKIYFRVEDASTWSEDLLNRHLVEEAHRPFDLAQGPLLRVHLFSRSVQEHILLLVAHHIVIDFWSLAVLVHELGVLYPSERAGAPAPLDPSALQYSDYVRWQADMLAGPEGERLWAYWQKQLGGKLPILDFPTDWPRPPIQTYQGTSESLKLNATLTRKLKTLGQAHGATLYMTLLAAFQVLLYRYTGQKDLLVGSPTAGRNRAELANLVGYLVNPVVLRANLAGNPTLVAFLRQVRQTVLSAFEHQAYPFAQLVERLQPARDASRSPLFQVMFILQRAPRFGEQGLAAFALGEADARIGLGGLELASVALEQRVAQFDLTLAVAEVDDGLVASFQYNTDLFEAVTIARMAGHLQALLEGIVADPDWRLSDLPLLTDAERRQLLVEWNDTETKCPQDRCIHELFEAQVERSPGAIAVTWGEDQLTYWQLNQRANQLAHYLQKLGVGPEVRVGVCVERSLEMVVGILGILKAGGVYVPLDPGYPQQRLAFIRRDAQMSILLTQAKLAADFVAQEAHACPELAQRTICLDREWEVIAEEGQEDPVSGVEADNLAYLIYTSGSTGRPKGVAIVHRSAVAMLAWSKEHFPAEDRAGVLASTSICFDLSVFELFLPLCWGGRVILAENALQLPTLPAAEEVTLINTVPSAMTELVRLGGIPTLVRTVNLAGESLQNRLVQQVYQQDNVQRVFNLYGPSEDTTYSTFAWIKKGDDQTPPIGRPVANTQVYVLGSHGELVPVGVPGELYIGGEGLARGYLDRPALTAERFVPDPFSGEPGARLYRTGDLARYLPNGELEFLGRLDHQVKIRGFRIELGEIEATLEDHEAMQQCVVVARENGSGQKELVAYLVVDLKHLRAASQDVLLAHVLQNFLQERLPSYMIPTRFVQVDKLPLTPSGKIDRRTLPEPIGTRTDLDTQYTEPRNETELFLAKVWMEVLDLDRVGIYDNFFDLGGHSLKAVQIVTRLNRAGYPIEIRDLFRFPTVDSLCQHLSQMESASAIDGLPLSESQLKILQEVEARGTSAS